MMGTKERDFAPLINVSVQGRPQREVRGYYQRTSDLRISTTDPDATPIRLKGGGTHLGGQASFDPRMTSVKSLCKVQGKTWEHVIRWCVEEGHQIYRLRRGTTFRFYVLPASRSLPH